MSGNRRPPEGKKKPGWSHKPLKPKQFVQGYRAGPLKVIEGHHCGSTKPCLLVYTKGVIRCQCQDKQIRRFWCGYFPFWDIDLHPSFVIVNEDAFDRIDRLPQLARVLVGKAEEGRQEIWVREEPRVPKFVTGQQWKREEQDIWPHLFNVVWGYSEYARYWHDEPDSDLLPGASPTLLTPKQDVTPTDSEFDDIPSYGGYPPLLKPESLEALRRNRNDAFLRAAQRPSANGHGAT